MSGVRKSGQRSGPLDEREADELFQPLAAASRIVVAVSGGADSLALLYLLHRWGNVATRPALAVATVDHGLRSQSAAEAARVAAMSHRLSVPHETLIWRGPKPATGVEAAARTARYALLDAYALASRASHLVTAHTRDDQAETVLLRLAAGSGPAGLTGMRAETLRGTVIHARPLLDIPKERLVATLTAAGLGWSEDESNRDVRFARARLRLSRKALDHEGLTDLRLTRLAGRMARLNDMADSIVAEHWAALAQSREGRLTLPTPELITLPEEIVLRLFGRAIHHCGGVPPRLERTEDLVTALLNGVAQGAASVRTLAGVRVAATPLEIVFTKAPKRRQPPINSSTGIAHNRPLPQSERFSWQDPKQTLHSSADGNGPAGGRRGPDSA